MRGPRTRHQRAVLRLARLLALLHPTRATRLTALRPALAALRLALRPRLGTPPLALRPVPARPLAMPHLALATPPAAVLPALATPPLLRRAVLATLPLALQRARRMPREARQSHPRGPGRRRARHPHRQARGARRSPLLRRAACLPRHEGESVELALKKHRADALALLYCRQRSEFKSWLLSQRDGMCMDELRGCNPKRRKAHRGAVDRTATHWASGPQHSGRHCLNARSAHGEFRHARARLL